LSDTTGGIKKIYRIFFRILGHLATLAVTDVAYNENKHYVIT